MSSKIFNVQRHIPNLGNQKMDVKEANLIFDYLEQVAQKDGIVTKAEFEKWHEKIGPDLDGDGVVSDKKLYVLKRQVKSKWRDTYITSYDFKTESCEGYIPYMIGPESEKYHGSELDLARKTTDRWMANFQDLVQDGQITRTEFVERCLHPVKNQTSTKI
jgi:hypothetical protein